VGNVSIKMVVSMDEPQRHCSGPQAPADEVQCLRGAAHGVTPYRPPGRGFTFASRRA